MLCSIDTVIFLAAGISDPRSRFTWEWSVAARKSLNKSGISEMASGVLGESIFIR
jgi:hypothetical protein